MDRGFLFGDSIYEIIPNHCGKLIGAEEHYTRMQQSLNAVLIDCPFKTLAALTDVCYQLIERNQQQQTDCGIYFQISRGAEEYRFHRIPDNITPTIAAFCINIYTHPYDELIKGFKAITREDLRRDTNFIKSNALIANVMLYNEAKENNAIETVLLRNNMVLECTSSNLFIVKDTVLMTPPLSDHILAGVTRSLVLRFAHEIGIQALETDISEHDLQNADEIWVTGSLKEICPIVQLNDLQINHGKVGSLWYQMHEYYQAYKESSL